MENIEKKIMSMKLKQSGNNEGRNVWIPAVSKQSDLSQKLQLLNCPFSWKATIDDVLTQNKTSIFKIEEKYKETEVDKDIFTWNKFILKVILCYMHFQENNLTKSLLLLKDAEEFIGKYDAVEGKASIMKALTHVVLGMKANLMFHSQDFESTEDILEKVLNDELGSGSRAAIIGIKAAFLIEFPPRGTELALVMLKEVISLDGDYAEWHFLLGKCLGRIRRRDRHPLPTTEEIKALETAVSAGRNVSYRVFLAQAYRELAENARSLEMEYLPDFKSPVNSLFEKSYNYYKESLELEPENCSVNTRCAIGFEKLPSPYGNLELAIQCIEKALTLTKNNLFVTSIAGTIYGTAGDFEKAMYYTKMSGELGSYYSYIYYILLNLKRNHSYNPLPDLEATLEKCCYDPYNKINTLCNLGCFYHFKEKIFEAAVKHWKEAVDLDPNYSRLKDHQSMFSKKGSTVNIYDLLHEDAMILSRKQCTPEKRDFYGSIIKMCKKRALQC